MHAHLSIVSDCHDVIKNLGRKVAQVFYNGLSRCLIVKPTGQGDSERICDLPYLTVMAQSIRINFLGSYLWLGQIKKYVRFRSPDRP